MTTELKNRNKGFFMTPNDLLDKWLRIIGPGAFIVYQEFIRFCRGGEHIPFPTVTAQDWAAWIGMSYPSFLKHINCLEQHGLIRVHRGRNKSKFIKEAHQYEILQLPEVMEDQKEDVPRFPKTVRFGDPLQGEPIFKTQQDSPYKNSLLTEDQNSLLTEDQNSLLTDSKKVNDNNSTVKSNSTERVPSQKIQHFVKKFYDIQMEQFPNFIKQVSPAQISQSCDTVDKLVRIDKFTLPQVFQTILWATEDDFWARQVLSITGLRNRSKNGLTKFQNIIAQKEEKSATTPTSTSPRGQLNSTIVLDDSFLHLDDFEQAQTPTPYSQRLYDFAVSFLGQVDKARIRDITIGMKAVYDHANTIPILGCPDPSFHPNHCVSWHNFFDEWIEFLEKKQQDGFVLRSVRNLEQTDTRWREYMQYCAWRTNHDWQTGAHI